MQAHGISYTEKKKYDSYFGYVLEGGCLFEESHTGTCAMLTLGYDGIPGYKCKHINTCGDKKWRDVRMLKEPEFYAWHPTTYDEDDGRIDAGWAEHKKMMARTRVNDIEEKENEAVQTQIEEEDIPLTGPATSETGGYRFTDVISAKDLLAKDVPEPIAYVGVGEEVPLLCEGTCILSAKPKCGKSWLALALCIAVANGEDFLGYHTKRCRTLYLDLESGMNIRKKRLKKAIVGHEIPDNFDYVGTSRTLDTGILDQIENYIKDYPDTGLVIIDVFEKVRTAPLNVRETDYKHAYRDLDPLNAIADKYHISIVLVSHNRKAIDPEDHFANILGSTGLQAAVSQMIVLEKKRTEGIIQLFAQGRPMDGEIDMGVKLDDGQWSVVGCGNSADREKERLMQEYVESPIRQGVLALMKENSIWKGRCSSIISDAIQYGVAITDTAKTVGGFLHRHQGRLLEMDGIKLQIIQSGTASKTYKFSHVEYDREPDEMSLPAGYIDMGYEEM